MADDGLFHLIRHTRDQDAVSRSGNRIQLNQRPAVNLPDDFSPDISQRLARLHGLGQQGKFTSIDQLKGKKVGVQNGTTHQKFITDKHPEITTVPYDSYQNAKLDLQNGRIDAVFGDTAVVTEWLKSNPKLAAVGDKVTDKAYFGTGLGIAVRQGNTDLQQKFNAALEKVKKDGTYQTIYNKWFQK